MTPSARPSVVRVLLLALLLCLIGAAWYGQRELQFGSRRVYGAWIVAAALAGVGAVLVGATRLGRGADNHGRAPRTLAIAPRVEWLAVGVLVGVGVLFRFIHFSTVPEGMNHDAAWYGMYAIYINQGAPYTPYVAAGFGRETMYMYIVSPFVGWLGNTQEAIQLASTLCGVAALVPLYLLGRAMFGTRIALIALAFLAVSGWHGVFSRVGWRVITAPPIEMLALYAAWRAVQGGRWRAWILMGAGAALSIYTYNAARIVPALSALLYVLCLPRQRQGWRRYATGGLLALATFLLVGLPMLWYATTHFDDFQRRLAAVSEEREEAGGSLLDNAWAALRMFNYRGNGDDFFIDEPLLEPVAAVGFLLGATVALRHARPTPYAFVLLGLLVSLLPGLLSVPNGNRGITAIPFVYLLIAIGLDAVLSHAAALLPRRWRLVAYGAAISIAVGVAGFESYAEFLGPDRRPLPGISRGATGAAQFMRRHMDRYRPYTISIWTDNTFIYLTHRGDGTPFETRWPFGTTLQEIEGEVDRRGDKGLMFLLDFSPAADAALQALQKRFPEHRIEPIPPPRAGGEPVGRALFVEADAVSRPWRNFSRSLFLRHRAGDPATGATYCGEMIGDARGVSAHVSVMVPDVGKAVSLAHIRFWRTCPPEPGQAPLVAVGISEKGLVAETDREETLVPFAALEAGRWYDVYVAAQSKDHAAQITVEGAGSPVSVSLPFDAQAPLQVSGVDVRAERAQDDGGQIYIDEMLVLGGALGPDDEAWSLARAPYRPSGGGVPPALERQDALKLDEHFDPLSFGPLAAANGWQDIVGTVAVVNSPQAASPSGAAALSANAFVGGKGRRPGEFEEPMGLAVDGAGNFYVTERVGDRVQKFAADGSSLASWGAHGDGPGEFHEPMDAAADKEFLYVVDSWNHRVQVFDWDGVYLFEFQGPEPSFYSPRGIDVRDGKIYVADSGHGLVRVFDRSGEQLMTIGENGGDAPGHLIEPVDVAVGAAGRIYVVNSGNNRIEVFRPDGTPDGAFPIRGWEGRGLKEGYLAIDANGTIYLSDPQGQQVRRFTTDGVELAPVPAELDSPAGLTADDRRLLVSARFGNHVRAIDLP